MQTPQLSPREKADFFRQRFTELVERYNICSRKGCKLRDFERIAYLLSTEMIILFTAEIGQDAECCFYEWAKRRQLGCDIVPARESIRDSHGRPLINPFSINHTRILDGITFCCFEEIAEQILTPEREPILNREPVIELVYI